MYQVMVVRGGMILFNKVFWGLVLIAIGVFFILDQRGLVTLDFGFYISTFWPIILIYFGLKGLVFQYRWGHGIGLGFLWPLIMAVLGIYFLGRNLNYIALSIGDFFQYIVPVLLIVVGIVIIFGSNRNKQRHAEHHAAELPSTEDMSASGHDSGVERNSQDSDINEGSQPANHFNLIGDVHIGHANWALEPFNVNHLIGDTLVDLTRANIPEGETKINIASLLGDVKVMLPMDEEVEVSVTMSSFLGDFHVYGKKEGGVFKNRREESTSYAASSKRIRIVVSILIGDFRIERV